MECERGEIPLPVWMWPNRQIIFVSNTFALNALRKVAYQSEVPLSTSYDILVFQRNKDRASAIDNEMHGGTPVLCCVVFNPALIEKLLKRFSALRFQPNVWLMNPHALCPLCYGVTLHIVREGDEGDKGVALGLEKHWKQLLHETNTLRAGQEEEEEEEVLF